MHLFKRFIAMPLLGPEDGAMSGGADDTQFDAGAQDFGSEGEAVDGAMADDTGGDESTGDAGRDEDDADLLAGDDDDDSPSLSHEERLRKIAKTNRRLKRQLAKYLPFRDLRQQGIDPSTVLQNARQFQALQQRIQSDPRLRKAIAQAMGGDDDGDSGDSRQPAGGRQSTRFGRPQVSDFDPTKAPWDTESESGRFFVGEAKLLRDIGKYVTSLEDTVEARLARLEGGIQSRDQREQHQQQQSFQRNWLSAVDAAAKKITNPGVRDLFTDNLKLAMSNPQAQKLGVQKVVAHYLKRLGVNPTQARIAQAAAQGRTAHNNGRLPRNMAGGNGTPTPARGQRERLSDVHKRLRTAAG